jgi:hypothetical protein
MYLPISSDNINTRKLVTNKRWVLDDTNTDRYHGVSSSYFLVENIDEFNDVYPELLYSNIKTQYYYNPLTGSALDYGYRQNYLSTDERVIGDTIIVLSIDKSIYGEKIKRGTFSLITGSVTLTDDGYSNLKSGSQIVGNIFYENGLIVLTHNVNTSSYENYEMQFNSTHTIYETEIFITIDESQLNASTNPTAIITYESGSNPIKVVKNDFISKTNPSISGSFEDYFTKGLSDPTGSYLRPYITTIGLYNEYNELLMVAKLARATKKLPDYPMNFIIRHDM